MNKGVPGQDFPGSDLGMAVQVLKNRHGRETMHSMGAGFTLVFVNLAPFPRVPLSSPTGAIALCLMALALGFLGRLGIDDFLAGEGFAQRTQRTPRFGKGNAEMFICCMGIDHE